MIMCACILHNLLIDHVIAEDWLEEHAEIDDDEELEQHDNERANRRDQVLSYMMKMR